MKEMLTAYAEFSILFYLFFNFIMAITFDAWIPKASLALIFVLFTHAILAGCIIFFVPISLWGAHDSILALGILGTLSCELWQALWLLRPEIHYQSRRIILLFCLPIIAGLLAYGSHTLLKLYGAGVPYTYFK